MKVILLKNRTAQLDKYDLSFRSYGFSPEFMPLLTHTHLAREFLELIKQPNYLDKLENIIITSQRTVECLSQSILPLLDEEARSKFLSKTVYTVGPVTKDFLERVGFKHIKGGENAGNGSLLADIIINDLLHIDSGKKLIHHGMHQLLFLVGEVRRDIIPKKLSEKGIHVQEVIVYKTQNMEDIVPRFQNVVEDGCWVVFFSPQGTEGILKCLTPDTQYNVNIASIGPTTEEYLNSHGIIPHVVSPKPDAENLLNAMQSYLKL